MRRFLHFVAAHPYGPIVVALVAILLTLPSLGVGLLADDYGMYLAIHSPECFGDFSSGPLDLFRFFTGDVEQTQQLMNIGFVPWWTYPGLHAAFWRPVSSLTHFFDYTVWRNAFWVMHLESILLYGAVCGLMAILCRRVAGLTVVAALAALLFAADHTHAMPVVFLANRNALLALLFGLLSILSHRAWRCDGRCSAGWLAHLFLILSLLSAEAGLATGAYLAAHAFYLESGSWKRRLWPLGTYGAVVLAWRFAWSWQGYGMDGCGIYTDPLREPLVYLAGMLERVPLLLLGQWFTPPSEIAVMLDPPWTRIHWSAGVLCMVFVALATWPLLRARSSSRFFAAGMLISLVPLVAAFPSDRMLLFVGVGAFGLMAEWIVAVFVGPSRTWPRLAGRILAVGGVALLLLRGGLSPVFLAAKVAQPMGPADTMDGFMALMPLEEGDTERDFVVVNPPLVLFHTLSVGVREVRGLGNPKSLRMLAPGWSAVEVRREDDRTLVIRVEDGFEDRILARLFRSRRYPLRVGDTVELEGLVVEALDTAPDGAVTQARFRFDVPLEDDTLRLYQWTDGAMRPFELPGVGEEVTLQKGALW